MSFCGILADLLHLHVHPTKTKIWASSLCSGGLDGYAMEMEWHSARSWILNTAVKLPYSFIVVPLVPW